jgi:hypothetical protein
LPEKVHGGYETLFDEVVDFPKGLAAPTDCAEGLSGTPPRLGDHDDLHGARRPVDCSNDLTEVFAGALGELALDAAGDRAGPLNW